jgi:nucleoside-diphosphate-sugar epimerase
MRILLIGGNGFIGSPLMRELHASGHKVAIFHRQSDAADSSCDVNLIQGDRNRLSEYRNQLQHFAPDVVIDLILSSGEQAQELMRVVSGIARRVVALSSMDVYRAWGIVHKSEPGSLEPLPLTESSPLRTVRKLYSPETIKMMEDVFSWVDEHYDKIAVEEAVMTSASAPGTILRLPMVYGPGDRLHRFFPLLKRIADGRSAVLLADDLAAWHGPRGYVDNVAHAIACAATSDRSAGHVYNICEEPSHSELEWQKMIANEMNWSGKFVVLPREKTPKHLLQPGNAAQHVVVSSEHIRTELGYEELVEVDEAIRRTIDWERRHPPSAINPQQFDYEAEDSALADVA